LVLAVLLGVIGGIEVLDGDRRGWWLVGCAGVLTAISLDTLVLGYLPWHLRKYLQERKKGNGGYALQHDSYCNTKKGLDKCLLL
jgi:hypothetical protein